MTERKTQPIGTWVGSSPSEVVEEVAHIIEYSKTYSDLIISHLPNLFRDIDNMILGSDWKTYKKYFKNIRKEYKKIGYFRYRFGRIKFISDMLNSTSIFRTNEYHNKYEEIARKNLKKELRFVWF